MAVLDSSSVTPMIVEKTTHDFIQKVKNDMAVKSKAKAEMIANWFAGYYVNNIKKMVREGSVLPKAVDMRIPLILFPYVGNDKQCDMVASMIPEILNKTFGDAEFTTSWTTETLWWCKMLRVAMGDAVVVTIRSTWPSSEYKWE